ncbi:MAG: ABC transporter ATP-binding protein [Stagnimonas sp.]|nr:ABC transporter ATP-binding protein [Stagnimonas sp.]
MAIIEARGLVKSYPKAKVQAVDGVSFKVQAGTCFGLLGPNGAGKSTTVEMLEGVAQPTAGEVLFKGETIHVGASAKQYRDKVGIQFQSTALQEFLTVRENLRFFAALYPKTRSEEELIRVCRLEDFLDRDTKKLSGGQRQRVLLAIALVNDPEVVFLDEPTTGLDPQARRNFWALVRGIKAEGKTVLLTTHYMEEAYELCDEIAIMDHGRIIAQGSPQSLLAQYFQESVIELPTTLTAALGDRMPFVDRGELSEFSTADIAASIDALRLAGVPLAQLRIRPPTLEDLFLKLTGKDLRA